MIFERGPQQNRSSRNFSGNSHWSLKRSGPGAFSSLPRSVYEQLGMLAPAPTPETVTREAAPQEEAEAETHAVFADVSDSKTSPAPVIARKPMPAAQPAYTPEPIVSYDARGKKTVAALPVGLDGVQRFRVMRQPQERAPASPQPRRAAPQLHAAGILVRKREQAALINQLRREGRSASAVIEILAARQIALHRDLTRDLHYLNKLPFEIQVLVAHVAVHSDAVLYYDDDGQLVTYGVPDYAADNDMLFMNPIDYIPIGRAAQATGGLLRRIFGRIAQSRPARMVAGRILGETAEQLAKRLGTEILDRIARGELGEQAARATLERAGYTNMAARLPGNRGFDGVFAKFDESGKVIDIIIAESKFSAVGRAALNRTRTMGRQMSLEWIEVNVARMLRSQDSTVAATGRFLRQNASKIRRKVNVFDGVTNRWNQVILP